MQAVLQIFDSITKSAGLRQKTCVQGCVVQGTGAWECRGPLARHENLCSAASVLAGACFRLHYRITYIDDNGQIICSLLLFIDDNIDDLCGATCTIVTSTS